MARTIYNEVTAVTGVGYHTDRVLGKLKSASLNLPYSLEDIKISHNDFAVTEVYNDSIRKLYKNYLYLIANAEIVTTSSPTSSLSYINVDSAFTATLCSTATDPATGNSLSTMSGDVETHIAKKTDSNEFVYFNYSPKDSVVYESTTKFKSLKSILAGNFVEYNKTFKFKNIVSVDIVNEFLFVLDRGLHTLFKFDITGLLTNDTAVRRTGITDTNPGRYLLKTIGGTQYTEIKNRLVDPVSVSIHDEKIYILDNGTHSIKVYDLNFNYLTEAKNGAMYNQQPRDIPVSVVVDQISDTDKTPRGYILSSTGKVYEYDPRTNTISQPWRLFESYLPFEIYAWKVDRPYLDTNQRRLYKPEGQSFNKIVNSKSSKNILYISTNRNIYKVYKTRLDKPITALDFTSIKNLTTDYLSASDQMIVSFDTALHNGYDYMAITTTTLSSTVSAEGHTTGAPASGYKTSTYLFTDKNITEKLYNENFYTNYFTLSDIFVLPQEIVNNITLNKTTKKLIYNHYSFFENLNKKLYSYYTKASFGTTITPAICTLNDHQFNKPSTFNDDSDFYIGVNEPLLTDVVNRPLELLYRQQEALFDFIKEEPINTEPPAEVGTRLPGKYEIAESVISLSAATLETAAGDPATITVLRRNNISVDNQACSFYYYTVPNTATVYDFQHVYYANPSVGVFERGQTEFVINLDTVKFIADGTLYKDTPATYNKTFNLVILQKTNCIVDPDKESTVVTIKPVTEKYDITLFGATAFSIPGYKARVGVQRTSSDGDYTLSAACNIRTVGENLGSYEYEPIIIERGQYSVYSQTAAGVSDPEADFPAVPDGTDLLQRYAKEVVNTSTILFLPGVSSIVFDITTDSIPVGDELDAEAHVNVVIHNAGPNSDINQTAPTLAADMNHEVYLKRKYKPVTLNLNSIASDFALSPTVTNMVSSVNIWDALSAATVAGGNTSNWIDVSAYPISVTFTVGSSLSVISTDTTVPALYIKPPKLSASLVGTLHDEGPRLGEPWTSYMPESGNKIEISIATGSAVVGKGGRGGHGALLQSYGSKPYYDYGFKLIDEIENTESVAIDLHSGLPGGPALSGIDSYFNNGITITNNGKIYGGAGGGGGGVGGVSARELKPWWSRLGIGGGGGGGGGIHAKNIGEGGLPGMSDSLDQSEYIGLAYVSAGPLPVRSADNDPAGDGTEYKSKAPMFDVAATGYPIIELRPARSAEETETDIAESAITAKVSDYPGMIGLAGGNIGEAGGSDSASGTAHKPFVDGAVSVGAEYSLIDPKFTLRVGGAVGHVIKALDTTVPIVCAGSSSNYSGA